MSDTARRAGGAKRPPSSHASVCLAPTRAFDAPTRDSLALLTLLARPILCAQAVVAFAFASPGVAVLILWDSWDLQKITLQSTRSL